METDLFSDAGHESHHLKADREHVTNLLSSRREIPLKTLTVKRRCQRGNGKNNRTIPLNTTEQSDRDWTNYFNDVRHFCYIVFIHTRRVDMYVWSST